MEVVAERNNNESALAAAFEKIRNRSRPHSGEGIGPNDSSESVISELLSLPCQTTNNLKSWEVYELKAKAKNDKIRMALCKVARKYLNPPPTSTNCERLFSAAGQIMDEKRAQLKPGNLDKILFLRENLIVNNLKLD